MAIERMGRESLSLGLTYLFLKTCQDQPSRGRLSLPPLLGSKPSMLPAGTVSWRRGTNSIQPANASGC